MPRDYDDEDDRPRPRRRSHDDDDDDDDGPRRSRRLRRDDDDEDRPRRRKKARPQAKEMSVAGMIGLIIGALALVTSLIPCFASLALIPAGIGLAVGLVALMLAQKSDGRQGAGLPIAALSVSAVAVLIGVGWLVLGKQLEKRFDRDLKQMEADAAKEDAARKKELASAAKDVQAGAGNAIHVTAAQFFKAYDDDEDQADRVYKNKVLEVTGVVHELDFTGDTYTVHLKAGPDETVNCEFAKDPNVRARLAQLKPGDQVTIRGKCLGGDASIEACVLVE